MSKKSPQLRFEGFTDDWEERKLGDIAPLRGGFAFKSSKFRKTGVPIVRISNILSSGEVGGDFAYYDEQDKDDKYILPDKSAVLAMSGATTGKVSILSQTDYDKVYQNQRVGYFQSVENIDYGFISTIVRSELFVMQLDSVLVSGAQPNVSSKEIDSFNFMIPILVQEQQKIGSFFKQLDETIALHQRKLDLLKEQKKGYLQKMFPKNGEKVPELRFAGFADDWEQCKLSDEMTDFIVPMRDKPKEFGGNIPWTRIEDIEGKFLNDSLSEQYVTEETIQKMNLKIIPKDSLIVSSSATFGVVAMVTQDLITNQTFIGLVPREKNTLDYWYSFFQSSEARKYMKLQSAGSTIFYIARDSFEKMPISVPKIDEMIKIGEYFSNLDNLIALHQRKLDLLKEQKKGFLQKMFV
ncbi:restriction endonuclease subunit S [Lactococcus petauri]